ncbi:hypothetical protein MCJ35_03045 [Enterocloster sp. OA13]|uniref:DUF6550 family protein n=1 Tax=Enterocloster sp. OA13 TaxID=2914161 RepID=UPI000472BDB2|nr:hypothetical protein [Enterocloster sp. OA13]
MKNEYNKKKRITIITLSAVAVCLAGGLFWYMGTLGNTQPPVAQTESQPETEPTVIVPEIHPETTQEPSAPVSETISAPETEVETEISFEPETTAEPETTSESETKSRKEPDSSRVPKTVTGDVQEKPSADKPKSPIEATPPSEPPTDTPENSVPVENPDADGQCQPEHTPQPEPGQPQAGEKQDGKIYVPGFGWVDDKGGGSEVHEAPNAGTGKPIGEM